MIYLLPDGPRTVLITYYAGEREIVTPHKLCGSEEEPRLRTLVMILKGKGKALSRRRKQQLLKDQAHGVGGERERDRVKVFFSCRLSPSLKHRHTYAK